MLLSNSKVYRGGVSSSNRVIENTYVTYQVNWDYSVGIHFEIPSKGGGTTAIAAVIGREDLDVLIEGLAEEIPRFTKTLLSGAMIASGRDQKYLKKMDSYSNSVDAKMKTAFKKVEEIESHIEKVYLKSSGEGELDKAFSKLQGLKKAMENIKEEICLAHKDDEF